MRKHIMLFLLGCLIFDFSNTNAQIIDRKVISSGGVEYSTSYLSVSYTIGETFVNTFINNGLILTQGFQQPDVAGCNLQVNQGMDTVVACGPSVMLSADSGFTNYSWSNGDSAQSTSVTASGWYFCSGYQNGCLANDSIYVSLVNAQININDTTICLGTDIRIEVLESNGAILQYQNNNYQVSGTSPLKPWGPMNNVSTNSSSLSDGLQNTLNAVAALGNYNGGDYAANYCHQLNEKGFTDWYLPSWNELSSMLCNSSGMIPGWAVPAYYWSSTERTDNWAYKGFSGNLSTPCGSVAAPVKTDYCNVRCIRKSSTKTYLWSTGATTPSITITPSQTTVYYVTVSNGISSCTDSVQITISGSPEEIIMEDTISSCADSVLIAALPGFSDLTWSSLQTGPQIHARTTGLYKVIGTNAGGCTVKDSVVVSIVNLNMNNDTSICIGGSVVLSAQSGFPYLNNLFDGSRFLRSVQNGPGGQTQRTFSYWLRTTDSTAMNVLTYGDGSSGTSLLSLMLNLNLSYGAGSGWCAQNNKGVSLFSNSHAATFAKIVHDGKWHHIAYVLGEDNQFSFDKIKFYVDGNLISQTPASIPYCGHNWGGWTYNTVATPIKFGAAGWGGPFRGGLSQVGIWNSALDSSDIRRVRNQGVLSIVNDLAHYYPLDKLKQDTIIEDEFGSNDCIIQGNASNISTRAFSGTETLSFLWSNGETSPTIEVHPTQTTTYYVTVSNGISSCTDSVTVTVLSASTYFTDNDNDGYGDSLLGNFCEPPPGALTDSSDCDGSNPSVNPGATEVCNGIDDDCDGQTDGLVAPSLGPIHGPAVQCIPLAQGNASFYVDSLPGTTGYQWMLPSGLTLLSGQGTDSITIQWPLSMAHTGISGPLSVSIPGLCGTSVSTIQLNMQISVPARSPSVSGPIRLCAGDSATYSVFPVARAHFYEWTLPAGLHFVGDSTGNIIRVIADSNYLGGFLSVMAVNACGKSLERTKTLTRNIAITPSPISGITNGLCNMQGVIYSVIPQAGYLHSWSLPAGIQLVSGQGTASIVVNYTGSFTSGQISVTRSNTCGTSLPRTISVSSVPGRPSSMNGPLNLCPGAMNQPYSSSSVTGATGYQWSVFSGALISSGQGTKNITVDYPFITTNGQSLSVSALNACGSGPQRTLSGITLSSAYCGRMGEAKRNLEAYPNPTGGWLYLKAEEMTPRQIEVYNILGECVINTAWKTELDMRTLPAGVYVLKVRDEDGGNMYRRIEVQR